MSAKVEIMKTKAEQSIAQHFADKVDLLASGAADAESRRAAFARFLEYGLPHRRIEAWKYTDLRNALGDVDMPAFGEAPTVDESRLNEALGPLGSLDAYRAVFVNGRFDNALSALPETAGIAIRPLSGLDGGSDAPVDQAPVDQALEEALSVQSIVALNTAFLTDGLNVSLADGVRLDKPLMIITVRAGGRDILVTTRHRVEVGAGAGMTLIEAAVSADGTAGQANSYVSLDIHAGGSLEHAKIGTGDSAAVSDLATSRVKLDREAYYRAHQLTPGAPLSRNQVFVTFDGEDAELDFTSAVLGNGSDHIDSTIVVEHRAPGCKGRELFKAVLDDRARAVCQGKVIVQRDAQKTDGKQMAQALMLSEDCEFDSKPELEIYADDVACGHGSTSAEIDADLIFYCRSRGIPEAEAKVMLTESFIAEAIDNVDHDGLRDAMGEIVRTWLADNHSSAKTAL